MFKRLFVACGLLLAICSSATSPALAAGPFGTIHVGNWIGGAFSDDSTGAFSHCSAMTSYASGVSLVVGQNAANAWLLGFASPAFKLNKGDTAPIDVTFDGQSQARLFATASSSNMLTAILPVNVARTFQRASLMVGQAGQATLQFNLTLTGPLLSVIATCVTKVKADGLNSAGDFAKLAAKPVATGDAGNGAPASPRTARNNEKNTEKSVGKTGTGFVISAAGISSPTITSSTDAPISTASSTASRRPRCAWSRATRRTILRCCRDRRGHSRTMRSSAIARFTPAIRWS
jgi:hypothetical protein